MSDTEPDILHEEDVRAVIRDELQGGAGADQADAIADAVVAHALNATFSDTEVEAALNALGVKVNAILAVLRENGTIATA